tara:strand:- start:409 stop:1368 length:960 start_codon:yes stop_codon:yes gene_type:complete
LTHALYVGVTHVIAMIRIISLIFLFLLTVSCGTDYSVITNEEIEIVEIEPEVETEIIIDYFVQPEKPENLDVLVVLDTSCSMSDNYENVSLGLDLLRGDIEVLTYDYQMALINSSLNEPYFAGIIYPDTSSMEIFLAPYSLGVDRFETAFTSLYQFTTTPEGEDFLREGVDKLYIFVSDEPEQSAMPVSLFTDWMAEYHEDVTHDVVVIGVTDSSECDIQYHTSPDAENRFLILANHYNKMIIDICGDFQLALAENSFLVKPVTHINLSKIPEPESIVVYQDGIKEGDWYYLSNTNTVYFDFEILEGAVIKIGYETIVN